MFFTVFSKCLTHLPKVPTLGSTIPSYSLCLNKRSVLNAARPTIRSFTSRSILCNKNVSRKNNKKSFYSTSSSSPSDVSPASATENGSIQTGRLPRAANITPTTRVLRRSGQAKYPKEAKYSPSQLLPCTTITECEKYDLPKVIESLHLKGFKDASFLIPQEAVHLQFPNFDNNQSTLHSHLLKYDIFVLVNGSVVAWGFDENFLRNNFLPLIEDAKVGYYKHFESEEMDFFESNQAPRLPAPKAVSGEANLQGTNNKNGNGGSSNNGASTNNTSGSSLSNNPIKSGMDDDIIIISNDNVNKRLLDKAAFSFGLARSTKLAILESQLEIYIEETRRNTLTFSKGITKRNKSQQHSDTLKMIGKLLLIRGELNLYSELIETPDLYWSEPALEDLYKKISKNLDVVPRIGILNKKLDYATEECRILVATLNDAKASQLELIIIYLILVEVCFETFHFYERYWTDKKQAEKK